MKRIAYFAVCGLAALVLLIGIVHAAIVVSNNPLNQRTIIVSAGDFDSNGRIMATEDDMPEADAQLWRFVEVSHDHVERITQRQSMRRSIRHMELQLDNWNRVRPFQDPANDDQRNANALARAELEADIAVARTALRVITTTVNMLGVSTFFNTYMLPFSILTTAAVVIIVNLKRGKPSEQE
ncbi:MAG: hypothetical protein FWE03_04975 [Firmicutes bacterium]|nr:hypothetical protein [Bacillota bacterium]